jgi:uncharacterized protein YceK
MNHLKPSINPNRCRMAKIIIIAVTWLSLNGCATIETVSNFTIDSPKVYSGTRLDNAAMAGNHIRLRVYKEKFHVEPPENPEEDIFFSFLMDTIILPVTASVALFEVMFGWT